MTTESECLLFSFGHILHNMVFGRLNDQKNDLKKKRGLLAYEKYEIVGYSTRRGGWARNRDGGDYLPLFIRMTSSRM